MNFGVPPSSPACHEGPNFLVFGLLTFTTAGHLLADFRKQDVMTMMTMMMATAMMMIATMIVTMLLMRKMKKIKIKTQMTMKIDYTTCAQLSPGPVRRRVAAACFSHISEQPLGFLETFTGSIFEVHNKLIFCRWLLKLPFTTKTKGLSYLRLEMSIGIDLNYECGW